MTLENQQKQSLINYFLLFFLICIIVILFLSYCYKKKKKEVENQKIRLQQILKEQKNNIKENDETDYKIQSNIYLQLHQAIHNGVKLTEEDWQQLSRRLMVIRHRLDRRLQSISEFR